MAPQLCKSARLEILVKKAVKNMQTPLQQHNINYNGYGPQNFMESTLSHHHRQLTGIRLHPMPGPMDLPEAYCFNKAIEQLDRIFFDGELSEFVAVKFAALLPDVEGRTINRNGKGKSKSRSTQTKSILSSDLELFFCMRWYMHT